jgi:hypothetical protein
VRDELIMESFGQRNAVSGMVSKLKPAIIKVGKMGESGVRKPL